MKNQSPTTGSVSESLSSLQQLVSNLVNSFLSTASQNNTQLVNEVRKEIALGATPIKAIEVIRELLETVIANSSNGEIHITAERLGSTILLQIQERNNNNGYALAYSIGTIEPTALSAGGHISINGPQKRVATISFSFPDQLVA